MLLPLSVLAQPIILPRGTEGFDLSHYDVKNRAPALRQTGDLLQIQAPKIKPDPMPRTLVRGYFRYVGASNMGVRLEDATTHEYYCPGRLMTALKMTEWISDTPVVIGVYAGAEGRQGVVSAFPESPLDVLLGWTRISPPAAPELVMRSPVGESFVCSASGHLQPQVVLSTGPVAARPAADGLQLYEQASSDWKVATWYMAERTYALVCPTQDFEVMLSSLFHQ